MFGRYRYSLFLFDEMPFHNRTTMPVRYYDEEPTESEKSAIAQEEERKKQRAAVQSKRHKSRTFYKAPEKEVPAILKNFVRHAQ